MNPEEAELRKIYTGKFPWHEEQIQDSMALTSIRNHIINMCKSIFLGRAYVIGPIATNMVFIRFKCRLGIEIIVNPLEPLNIEVIALIDTDDTDADRLEDRVAKRHGSGFTAYCSDICNPNAFNRLREVLEKLHGGAWRKWDVMEYIVRKK